MSMFAAMRLFLATVVLALAFPLFAGDAQNQQPSTPKPAASQPSIPLSDVDRQRLKTLGWPRALPA